MQVVLVMFRGDGEKRSFSIPRDMTVIGRREDCDLRIPLGDVSRKHCRLVKDADQLRIEDLGSSNGTYVNGQRVQESPLNPGDTIQIGPIVFVVQIDGVPVEDEMQPFIPATAAADSETGAPIPDEEITELTEVVEDEDAQAAQLLEEPEPAAGEFDPLEALQAPNEDSEVDFVLPDDSTAGAAADEPLEIEEDAEENQKRR